jgi:hypothetical protein
MSDDFDDFDDFDRFDDFRGEEEEQREPEWQVYPRDSKIDETKRALKKFFSEQPDRVFYEQQLKVLFEEKPYSVFQWITGKALGELRGEDVLRSKVVTMQTGEARGAATSGEGAEVIRFFWSRQNRYVKRQMREIRELVMEFSRSTFGRALGQQGEMLADNALMSEGFAKRSEKVREWNGKRWEQTGHDLDRVYERDGVAYATEVKNTLKYIEKTELFIKARMCEFLGLRPLVIARSLPKSYVEFLRRRGGFGFIVGKQLYPFGYEELAERVRSVLGFRVECSRRIEAGRVRVFLDWHLRRLEKQGV